MTPESKIREVIAKYQTRHELVVMARNVYETVKHRATVTKAYKTAFDKMYPTYTCVYDRDDWQTTISVWGNGVEYNDRLFMCWNNSVLDEKGYGAFEFELERNDTLDYIARLERELELLPKLDAIKAQIDALSAEAKKLCEFTVPSVLNRENWGASYTLQEFYPMLKRF